MARPKGVKQKRNELKYWLPNGVILISEQSEDFNKETILFFSDKKFGVFKSNFKAIQHANASTHPNAIQERREQTNLVKYGGTNPSNSKKVRQKAKNTMIEKYGVEHALQNEKFLTKSKETLKSNYNVDHPMYSFKIKQDLKKSLLDKYGVDNVMKVPEFKKKQEASHFANTGYTNPSFNPKTIEKILQNQIPRHSKGELEIKKFIENELHLATKTGFIGGESPKQLDIVVIDKNLAIEFNGAYWHSEANPNIYKNYHYDKWDKCNRKDIKLIQIFDFEWENRKQQIQSFLRSALGCNEIRLDARKLILKEIDKKEACAFLDAWHILGGKLHFIKAYGLIDNDHGLVSLITVGRHHRNNKEFVLSRYCGKGNISVRGGLSRLTNLALTEFQELTTWIDLRFANSKGWENSGWVKINQLPPDYFYYNTKTNKIISKQSRKKSLVNTPSSMTEHEHAKNDSLARIYDCGKIKLKTNKM
jgi:hypothetical protein